MALSIGIDLGTTNSVAGIATPSGVRLAVDEAGRAIHASVVSFPEGEDVIVGNQAKIRKATDPNVTVHSAKRLIGQNIRNPLLQLAIANLPYPVSEGENQQPIINIGQPRTVPEVSAEVLKYLKRLCEEQFGDVVESACVTVPANFSDGQRQATKEACRLAGLQVSRLVNEPTAAALAYGYGRDMDQRIAVFDFGGGTFDLSLLKVDGEVFEVLATDGEFFLGGDDIDRIVAEFLAAEMNRTRKFDPRPIPAAMNRLNVAAEQIKQYLTENDESGGTIDGIIVGETGDSISVDFELTRDNFNNLIAGYVDRTIDLCRNVMVTANMDPKDVDEVVLVGGSTRIPLVRQRICEYFGREPAASINPDEVVAHGAAIQAATLSGSLHQSDGGVAAEDTKPIEIEEGQAPAALLLDVTSQTLRIATAGGFSEVFLEQNSPIPIERKQIFTTAHDNQERVVIQCSQGVHRRHDENELLGTLVLEEIPPGTRGERKIEVTFRVDTDSILHVRAQEPGSGKTIEATLNVVGAPVQNPGKIVSEDLPASAATLPDVPLDKEGRKAKAKAAKEAEKADKKKKKEAEKADKKAKAEKAKADKKAGKAKAEQKDDKSKAEKKADK